MTKTEIALTIVTGTLFLGAVFVVRSVRSLVPLSTAKKKEFSAEWTIPRNPWSERELPSTWSDVFRHLNRSVMVAASQVVQLVAELPRAARRVLFGIAELPLSLSNRLAKRQSKSFLDDTSAMMLSARVFPLNSHEVEERLKAFIDKKHAEGWRVVVEPVQNGTLLMIVRPELEEAARALARRIPEGSQELQSKEVIQGDI